MSIDIVDLFETNPITKLNGNYQSKLIEKVKNTFTESQQQMFVASFYCYLNYHPTNDFVVDLDNVWRWLDFHQKYNAKYMLEKNFIINKDYKIIAPEHSGAKKHLKGGHNKEMIMLNIDTFKKFCLKAGTKKASEIHEYFIQLEYILQETLQEETNELKLQLQTQTVISEKEKEQLREKTLLEQFPNNTQCVYYGIIENLSNDGEPLVKFGNSNNLRNRVKKHKETYLNFRLVNVFKVSNKLQIENAIKEHPLFNERQRIITLKSKKYVELLNIQELSFDQLDKAIKNIITEIESNSISSSSP
jgi:phage anti-repressor protein